MATFKICVQKQRSDGFYPVYIRATHRRQSAFMKTDKMVDKKGLSRSGEVKDTQVLSFCSDRINGFVDRLNREDIAEWTVKEIVAFLEKGDDDVCFSDFARKYVLEMARNGQERNAKNYKWALQHLERYAGSNKIMFSRFTAKFVNDWISTMLKTARAKEMYPICVRQIFKAAMSEYNDYDRGIIRIKTNPWLKVKIPLADKPGHKAISAEEIRRFFGLPLPPSKLKEPLTELARDVAKIVTCLAGLNTADLFWLDKEYCREGKIAYNRRKTAKFRKDRAHMELEIPEEVEELFKKYKSDGENGRLLNFYKRFADEDSFNVNVNVGLRKICEFNNLPGSYSVYTFRHSWGTIARNDIKAPMYDVAFAMNHSSAHKVTEGYVKPDYSIASELNKKVVDYIFHGVLPDQPGQNPPETASQFRLSFKNLIRGTVFFREKKIYAFEDTGYGNVDEIIAELAGHIPGEIPDGCKLLFRIDNLDKNEHRFYERQKGKGC